ncbi:unnamed protein product [Adineta steineri]|uniref:phosphatidylinositol-3,5-bisphosphate 3-phosphatase n=1 Tax=Adineta steineri TaxID=433720 RepID=A0A814BK65_9BILA|nr:unnamed protein product [Adineta steineri]CAF3529571.1 unnamed protein product [Adineta steineri]
MVIGIPSSVTIVEEEDIHVCELPNSIPESLPTLPHTTELSIDQTTNIIEYPFEFLSGEVLIDHGMDLTDGYIYLTTFRLFIFSNQTPTHCSFINCPIHLIEFIEIKDNIYLYIQCKDIRSFRLIFFTTDKCCYWLRKLNESISTLIGLDDLFAIKYASAIPNEDNYIKRDYFRQEFQRLQLDVDPWRTAEINRDYKLSPTYPNICVVPASITDDEVYEVAKFRSNRRFPTVVWRHCNGAIIARTSQPEIGWLFWRSKEDEKMIQAIIHACKMPITKDSSTCELNSNRLLILDARSYTAALANRAKGGGFEHPPYYTDCDVQFMNLPNIHVIRKSAQMLRVAIANAAQGENWLSQLESTRWLHNLSALINAASFVVATVDKHARPVLVHCSDGWDRTPQITTLAKIMLDSYYRTFEGFQTLVELEWIAFGHKFADRCGHGNGASDPNERCPVFLQWLDCIYQLFTQNRTAFEFNEMFLLKLANHTYTCLYGTFLCNTDFERTTAKLETRTLSIWNLLNVNSKQFINHLFDKTKKDILYPSSSVRDLTIWSNLYLRDIRCTPTGSYEHSSTLIPARIRSYEDLSTSITNNLHRSTSDPNLSNSLQIESSALLTRLNNNSPLNQQQSQSNRLQNSTSTNSLFGPPHHLGTLNDGSHHNVTNSSNTNQISLPISNSPDNRMKRQSLIADDSSPDITQLALSFQRFPLNVNSVDNILRTMSRPRRHTNSTSSTASSLSEAWSLTRINSYDTNQTQRMMQPITTNKMIKLVRKRIDVDGLTKIPDQITSRMVQKERAYQRQIESLHEHIRRMQRFVYALININQNQNISPRIEAISQSNINSVETASCSSWQKIDNDTGVTRWIPDFNVQTCHLCHMKFQQWPFSRKHHCRKCGNVFCNSCTNYCKLIPSLNLTHPVRVCRDCFLLIDDNNNNTAMESTTRTATPLPIQTGCRQSNGTPNGSFNSPGGQKVKG